MERYDIAVIGSGPAGVSAAITATVRGKRVLLLGNRDLSQKMRKAHAVLNYPGLPNVSGNELADAFSRHIADMGIAVTEKRISAVYAMGDYFAVASGDDMEEASCVILACGVVPGKPLPGEEELLGRGVSTCATCDAALYRGRDVAVIGYSPREEEEAAFLSEVCSSVLYFPVYPEETRLPEAVRVVRESVLAIEGEAGNMTVRTQSGAYGVNGVFVLRDAVSPGQLVPGLETDGPHVNVDRSMATEIPGLFACGDITGTPYQYAKAVGEGNVAALSAVKYLAGLKKAGAGE